MTVNDYKKRFLNQLPAFYDETERLNLFYMAMEFVLNYSKADVVLNGNESVLVENQQEIDEVFNRLQDNEPIQYITQQANFFGYDFKVSPATLIPRPETEELVDWVLNEMKKQPQKNWRVLDIGTGTGCIPITIKFVRYYYFQSALCAKFRKSRNKRKRFAARTTFGVVCR